MEGWEESLFLDYGFCSQANDLLLPPLEHNLTKGYFLFYFSIIVCTMKQNLENDEVRLCLEEKVARHRRANHKENN